MVKNKQKATVNFMMQKMIVEFASDAAPEAVMPEVVNFMLSDALRLYAGEPVRLADRRESLEQLNLGRLGTEALEKAILDVNETSAKIAGRKNSVTVALQTLAIGLFEGYKR